MSSELPSFTLLIKTRVQAFCDQHKAQIEKCYVQKEGWDSLGVYPIVPNKADHEVLQKAFKNVGVLGVQDVNFRCLLNEKEERIPSIPGKDPVVLWTRP
jgi:hypothetical protein